MGSWGRATILAVVSTLSAAALAAPALGGPFEDPDFLIDVWETEQGLPENSATAMAQTPDGYLWFGTFNGLVRFDGVEFTVFDRSNTPELPSPGIVNLHLDRSGRLWVSTMQGLASVKDGRWTAHGESVGWVGNYVRFFVESARGELYATTFDGKILRRRGETFEELPPPAAPKLGFMPYVDPEGVLWVIHPQYIGKWVGGRWQETIPVRSLIQAERGDEISAGTARDGSLWIVTRDHLRKYRDGRMVAQATPPWPMVGFWSVHEDSQGAVWISSHKDGMYRLDAAGRWRHFRTGNGLTYHAARFAFEDREGNTWIGTSGGGLLRFKPRHFVNWGQDQGLPERVVKSLSADRRGRIAVGTNGQGVVWLEEGRFRPIPQLGGTPGVVPLVLATLVDRQDRLWVGSLASGLFVVEGARSRSFFTGGLPGPTGVSAYSLFEDSAGAVWMGLDDGDPLTNEGVTRYAGGEFRTYPLLGSPRHNTVHCLAQGRDGTLWAGTHAGGLYRRDGERFVPVPEAGALLNDRLSALLADADGTLWIGTEDGGIACLRGNRLVRISEAEGLPTRRIASIVDDGRGFLWLGSNRGVLRLAREELDAFVGGRRRAVAGQVFNLSDGLATVECTMGFQPNAARGPDGRLWFATYRGVLSVDPATLRLNGVAPPVRIEEVLIDGRPAEGRDPFRAAAPAPSAEVTVPAGTKRLEIHYAGLSFTAPEKVRFRYLLEGLDRDWIDVGGRRVAYLQDLKPGHYRFRVQAANNDGLWNEAGTHLALAVQPFLWQTLWFRALALLGLLAVVVLAAVRVTRSRLQLRIARLETERAEEKYRKIFENAVEGIFQTSPSGRFLAVNPALGYLLGYGPSEALVSEAIGLDERLFTDPARLAEFKQSLEERGYVQGFTARVYRRDHSTIWLSLNARAVRDAHGTVLYYEGTAEDVTERRRMEEMEGQLKAELEKAAAEWERTFDSMATPILIADASGRISRLNDAARQLAASTLPGEVVGQALSDLGPGQPWQTAGLLAAMVGQKGAAIQTQVRDPITGKTWDLSAGPSAGPSGQEQRVIVVARDVTQMIELQDSLRRSETMSAMGSLVAGVAHEVRNPLFSISANLDSFEATQGMETLFHPLIVLLRAEVDRLTALMQGLLDYGKPIEPLRSPGKIEAVIAEAVESCARLAATAEVEVENRVGPGLPAVLMDRKRLVQVFQNILQNAIQHAPAHSTVFVDASREGGEDGASLVITVSDSGPGLGADDLPRLFEPFFTRRRGGTGLGLAIVQRIVEEHGGTVSAANRPEGGAAVSVRLACVRARGQGAPGTIAV
jgi:PAS domain S-box-containing protein